jgi:hypothetical protein
MADDEKELLLAHRRGITGNEVGSIVSSLYTVDSAVFPVDYRDF